MTHTSTVLGITASQVKAISALKGKIEDWGASQTIPAGLTGFTTRVREGSLEVVIHLSDPIANHCSIIAINKSGGLSALVQRSHRNGFKNVTKSFTTFWKPLS